MGVVQSTSSVVFLGIDIIGDCCAIVRLRAYALRERKVVGKDVVDSRFAAHVFQAV